MSRLAVEFGQGADNAGEAKRILGERLAELPDAADWRLRVEFESADADGCAVTVRATRHLATAVIQARLARDFIAGAGHLLEMVLRALDEGRPPASERWQASPAYERRVHYMPGHFGNSFEVCAPPEMARYLDDLALSGASGYADWFDPNDMPDPYNPHVYCSTSMSLWSTKKQWLAHAQRLGLDITVTVTPNVGFVDQMRPEWVGVRDSALHMQGQVLCPSQPASRQVCLDNQRNLFADLRSAGIRVDRVVCAPYDDGGCAGEECQPYYPVFLGLVEDVHSIVADYFPEAVVDICGWWTSDVERDQLRAFVAGPAADWFGEFQFAASYGVHRLPNLREELPGIPTACFLHIGMSGDRPDVYIRDGVHSAGRRMASVIGSFAAAGCRGFMTYNEGFSEHYNAFVASRLGWGPECDLNRVTEFYCRLILGLRGADVQRTAAVLAEYEDLDQTKAARWARTLEVVSPRVHRWQKWAFEQIRLKAELMALDEQIAGESESVDRKRERVELAEWLWRQVYGLGVTRHILIPERMLPESCRALIPSRRSAVSMSEDA
jgi:hypothetical protein